MERVDLQLPDSVLIVALHLKQLEYFVQKATHEFSFHMPLNSMTVIGCSWWCKLLEDDEKLIVDYTRVRPDIVEFFMGLLPDTQKLTMEFLTKNPPVGLDLEDLNRRIRIGNHRFLREESTEGLVSDEELLYWAEMGKYIMDAYSFANEPIPEDVKCTPVDAGGVSAEWQDCSNPDMDKVILYFHGGGYVRGSIRSHRFITFPIGRVSNSRVLSVGYRLAPEHPFPAQLEDALQVYRWLLESGVHSSNVIIMGLSAGAHLSLSLMVKLNELGMEMPAGVVLKSPATDYTSITESHRKNSPLDPFLGDIGIFLMVNAFVGDADPTNPLLSPVYADLSSFPPLLLQVGTNEVMYDQCRMFVEKAKDAGVDAILQEFPEMVHGWHLIKVPEANDAYEKIGDFVRARLGS